MKYFSTPLLAVLLLACSPTQAPQNTQAPQPSEDLSLRLEKIDNKPGDTVDTLWGHSIADPYRWLEDAKSPQTEDWVKAQDARARQYLDQIKTRAFFLSSLQQLMYYETIGTPEVRQQTKFYFKRGAYDEKAKYYMQKDGVEQILLDPAQLSSDGSVSIGEVSVSPNGQYLAYKRNVNNADTASMHFLDLQSGKDLPEVIEGARYASPSWLPDATGFYYTDFPTDPEIDIDKRPGLTNIRFHRMGSAASEDKVIKPALNDATKFHDLQVSEDGRWLSYIIMDGWNAELVFIKDAQSQDDTWSALPNKPNTHYYTHIAGDDLYILTNDNAPRYRLVKQKLVPGGANIIDSAHWQEIIAEDPSAVIENFKIAGGKLFVLSIQNVAHRLKRYDLDGNLLGEITLPDEGSVSSWWGKNAEPDLYLSFQSPKLAPQILQISAESGQSSVWAQTQSVVPGSELINEQKWAISKDGTKIPMRILRKKSFSLNGKAPTIVYGYGGFNVSVTPVYRPQIFAWLERGGIYVYANLRGGGEFGEAWHQAGMGVNKQNVFDDYYAVAEYLIAEGYTSSKHMAAYGGSNGGLLVGAALTQRPSLFGAIVCAVPLLDMLRYHLFGSGRTWSSEYSTAETSEHSFETLRAYSPYNNVKPQTAYPAVLFLGADSDDRVDPMHARKMTAAIQDATSSTSPVILRIEKNAGHGGADMTRQKIQELADTYAFCDENLK